MAFLWGVFLLRDVWSMPYIRISQSGGVFPRYIRIVQSSGAGLLLLSQELRFSFRFWRWSSDE